VRDKNNQDEDKFVSFDKTQSGVIVQISTELETVKNNRCGKYRGDNIVLKTSQKLNRLLYIETPTIRDLINDWEITPVYHLLPHLFSSNCQVLASHLVEKIQKATNNVVLNIPGTEEKGP
jgi:hypothetical protein